ncbi:hypothetical protein MCAP1_003522 [Malassezia caprae]|uniref:Rad4-domain-containing protein n=1 Tax=Malassezia caprae TaxID=1381934 RepID=A0AAF0IX15_9BASI|nr:hypothetical protein MCAP1_003522 [Malassezia caprae]
MAPTPPSSARAPPTVDLTQSDSNSDDWDDVPLDVVAPAAPDDAGSEMDDVDVDGAHNAYAELYDAVPDAGVSTTQESTPAPSLQITFAQPPAKAKRTSTVTTTPRDRKNRLLVHQVHTLAILAATRVRNRWCNDQTLRDTLQDMVPSLLLHKLQAIHPRLEPERRERVRMFESFMTELVSWWHARFHVHARMAAAAAWRQPSQDLWQPAPAPAHTWIDGWCVETPLEREQRHKRETRSKSHTQEVAIFPTGEHASVPTYLRLLPPPEAAASPKQLCAAARRRLGSRETKAILFCALCRSLGIPARLVVSVQVVPSAASKGPARPPPRLSSPSDEEDEMYIEPVDDKAPPTVWVEVYSRPYQHWITVDPVRGFIKPTGVRHMEPLPSQRQNKLLYIAAFEEDGYARDVTARYTRTLHTRIARLRPSVRGQPWWASVAQALHRPQKLDRDAIEDVELEDQTRREPMPTSVGAFKDHPVYVLERHLLRDQVVHPPHRVGTFQGEPVYLRVNVIKLLSARQWYNVGRVVKADEVPLKWARQRVYTTMSKRLEEQTRATSGDEAMEGLFADFQTQLYVPPAVHNGYVPRNAFGNVDLFVPSMLPAGGTHIRHPLAARAAKQLGVSYADAVVGFEFRRFKSLPKMAGVVVPTESAELVQTAVAELEESEARNEAAKAQRRALKNWSRLLTALVVSKRVQDEYGAAPPSAVPTSEERAPQLSTEKRQLCAPEPAPEPTPEPIAETPVPSSEPAEQPARVRGPIVSLEEMVAAEARASSSPVHDTPSPAAPKRRRIVIKRSTPTARRSARFASRERPSYDESDE